MSGERFCELRWNGVPDEVKGAMGPLIREHIWILPSWVESVDIEFVTQADTTSLQIKCQEEYRRAYLNIMPTWLGQTAACRSRDVRHEFLHACIDPLHTFGCQLIEATVPKGSTLETWAHEQLRMAVEKAACDLENMLQRCPWPKDTTA